MQRFHVPYNLKAIPEIQEYLHASFEDSRTKNDMHDLYRRRFVAFRASVGGISLIP
jgi:son of sevenless-like protein